MAFFRSQKPQPLPSLDLRQSLELVEVSLPELAAVGLPPLTLQVGLQEIVLLEGLTPEAAGALLAGMALLRPLSGGRVYHWGMDLSSASRESRFLWRRRIAYISQTPALLEQMTTAENLTLAERYLEGRPLGEILAEHRHLLAGLGLEQSLDKQPAELSAKEYRLAVWGREFLKGPRLILWAPEADEFPEMGGPHVLSLLYRWAQVHQAALLVVGQSLAIPSFQADRWLQVDAGGVVERILPRTQPRPLTAYLPLLSGPGRP